VFLFAKMVEYILDPAGLLWWATAAGVLLLFTRRWRVGRMLAAGTVAAAIVLDLLPFGPLVEMLEDRFPPPAEMPAQVDGIVVLGGSIDPVVSAARGRPTVVAAADRITALVALVHRYPQARAVFTGGAGNPLTPGAKEAPWVRTLLAEMGCDASSVAIEDRARNTHENAVLTKALMRPKPGETWLLVTSAVHMPRAVGAFRAVGWPVVAYPVDYQTDGTFHPAGGGRWLDVLLHEGLGLAWYRLQGWSDALLPAP